MSTSGIQWSPPQISCIPNMYGNKHSENTDFTSQTTEFRVDSHTTNSHSTSTRFSFGRYLFYSYLKTVRRENPRQKKLCKYTCDKNNSGSILEFVCTNTWMPQYRYARTVFLNTSMHVRIACFMSTQNGNHQSSKKNRHAKPDAVT